MRACCPLRRMLSGYVSEGEMWWILIQRCCHRTGPHTHVDFPRLGVVASTLGRGHYLQRSPISL